jgi:hypothetical protein
MTTNDYIELYVFGLFVECFYEQGLQNVIILGAMYFCI